MCSLSSIRELSAAHFEWERWEQVVRDHGVEIDRPRGSTHPDHRSIIYPIDYGFIPETTASDGQPVDIFVGTANNGLVALIITVDHRSRDREFKLIYNCSPEEVYLVNGFINYDRRLMEGELVMRRPMKDLWA